MRKVVVLGTNYYIGLGVLRCLGRVGIPTVGADYDKKSYGMQSKYVKEKLWLTDYKVDPDKTVKELIAYAKRQDEKPLLIPTHDSYTILIDGYFDALKDAFVFPMEVKGLYTKTVDKGQLYELCDLHGVRYPETLESTDPDLQKKVEETIGYPCIVKPTDSVAFVALFRKKVFIAENWEMLREAIEKARSADIEVSVQRIIKGWDDHMYTYDAYVDRNGKVTHWMTGHKQRQWPINFGASTFIKQEHVPELHEIGAPFLEAIGWRGFAEIEFKKEEGTGKWYLIEINTRITNFNAMIEACGLNIPEITYRDMNADPVPPKAITTDLKQAFRYTLEDRAAKKAYVSAGQKTQQELDQQEEGLNITEAVYAPDDRRPWVAFWMGKIGRKLHLRR